MKTVFKLSALFVIFAWSFAIYYGSTTVPQRNVVVQVPHKYTTTCDTICKDWVTDETIGLEKRRVYEWMIRE